MYCKAIVFITFASLCSSKDLTLGPDKGGVLIFDNIERASPTLYSRYDILPIRAEDNQVIQRVLVTDYDEKKRGKVNVIEGGVGKSLVVLELKSPGVLRGYQFHVEVYAVNKSEYVEAKVDEVKHENPVNNRNKRNSQYKEGVIYFEYDSEEDQHNDSGEHNKTEPKIPKRLVPRTFSKIPKISKDLVPELPNEPIPEITTEVLIDFSTTQTINTQ